MSRLTRNRPCSTCGKPSRSTSGICRTCTSPTPKRPLRECPTCGITTTSQVGICRPCQVLQRVTVTDDDALTGGRWRRRGAIQVWQPDTEEADAA